MKSRKFFFMMSALVPALLFAQEGSLGDDRTETAVAAVKTNDAFANPISPVVYCADPTAIEHNGRIYVYATNDHQQFIANGHGGKNDYGAIKSLVVLSSADMVNWTHHGIIPVGQICGSWCYASWAPSIVSRVEEDGLTHFYLYFSNSGGGVGVITATDPLGPWTSPRNSSLISHSTRGVGDCNAPFDPGAVIDENGVGWVAFGGGDPNSTGTKLMPGNARIIKLHSDMVNTVGRASEIKAPYMFEASELNLINGRYVYTYCTHWVDGENWADYGSTLSPPTACSMTYMVNSGNPLNTDDWTYRGEYFANPGRMGFDFSNNHTHLQKYRGAYYLFYHTMSLERLKSSPGNGFRSVQVNRAPVVEATALIGKVTATNQGTSQLERVNPYLWQEAEMMANCGGIEYEHLACATNSASNSTADGTLALTDVSPGSWIMVRGVNFNSDSPTLSFIGRLAGKGILEVRLDDKDAAPAATLNFDSERLTEFQVDGLDASLFSGLHNVYLFFASARNVRFDAWTFDDGKANSIRQLPMKTSESESVEYFDLNGRKIKYGIEGHTGQMLIRKTVMDNGVSIVEKIVE